MRYALTGATGFIGGELARQLLAEGHDVTAVVRDPARAGHLGNTGVRVLPGDLSDRNAMTSAFRGSDGVFHVAGWYRVGAAHPEVAWRTNVEGTRNALAAASAAGVPRLVYTSTCAVNSDTAGKVVDETYRFTGTHLSVYDETKARAHDLAVRFAAEHATPEIVIVMPGGVYGPGDTSQVGGLMTQVASGQRTVAPRSLRMMQAHVADVARGHTLAMRRGADGESYILAGEQTDLLTLLTELADLTGGRRPLSVPPVVLPVAERLSRIAGRFARGVPLPVDFTGESLRVARASYWATPAKAIRELGWSFRPLRVGLHDTAVASGWLSGSIRH